MKTGKKRVFGRTILIITILVTVTILLLVYFTGLETHRSIIDNAFISLSILAGLFFLFLFTGLYRGYDVRDDLKNKFVVKWGRAKRLLPDSWDWEVPDMGSAGGSEGCLAAIAFWLAATLAAILLVIILEVFVWGFLLVLVGALYWILIRALKLIFSRSARCRGDVTKSMGYALGYTTLYIGWIYGVIYIATLF